MQDTVTIANNYDHNLALQGYMDEFRISRTGRYTSTFTPSTTAFTDDKDTVLLLHMDGDRPRRLAKVVISRTPLLMHSFIVQQESQRINLYILSWRTVGLFSIARFFGLGFRLRRLYPRDVD